MRWLPFGKVFEQNVEWYLKSSSFQLQNCNCRQGIYRFGPLSPNDKSFSLNFMPLVRENSTSTIFRRLFCSIFANFCKIVQFVSHETFPLLKYIKYIKHTIEDTRKRRKWCIDCSEHELSFAKCTFDVFRRIFSMICGLRKKSLKKITSENCEKWMSCHLLFMLCVRKGWWSNIFFF